MGNEKIKTQKLLYCMAIENHKSRDLLRVTVGYESGEELYREVTGLMRKDRVYKMRKFLINC